MLKFLLSHPLSLLLIVIIMIFFDIVVIMQSELLIAVISGLGGMLGWGLADFFAKKTIDEIGDVTTLAIANVFGTITFIGIALISYFIFGNGFTIPANFNFGGLLIFGALQAAVYLFAYAGFGKGQIAVLNPVFASYSGAAALISIVLLGEAASLGRLLSLGVVFIGILGLSLDIEGLKARQINLAKTPGLKEVLMASFLAAFWTLSWDKFVGGNDWLSFALFMFIFMTVMVFVYAKAKKIKLEVKKPGMWKFLFLIGFCETVAYASVSLGFGTTSLTSVVVLLSGAFSLPTIILARIFLKEKVATTQTVGTLIIILGIVFLSLS